LEIHRWNRRRVARALSISYAGLLGKMREAGLPPTRGPKAYLEPTSQPEQELSRVAKGSA
jgi:hypothetical protein